MGVNRCTVLVSDQVASPLVFHSGFRVTLLLPKAIIDSAEPSEMAAILTHELSHVVSRDLEWNLWIKMVSALLWPHPLLWRVRKTHVAACEFVADADSARRMNDPALYVSTLAKVALNASAANQKQMPGLAMARTSSIRFRTTRTSCEDFWSASTLTNRRMCIRTVSVLFTDDIVALATSVRRFGSISIRERESVSAVPVMTMNSELDVSGSVTDAKTGEPIRDFDIVPAIGWESNPPTWEPRFARKGTDGEYNFTFNSPRNYLPST